MKRTIILTSDDEDVLATLCEQFPLAPRHRILQTLIRIGGKVALADPAAIVAEAANSHANSPNATRADG
jgi:hypothetical protein